MITNAYIYQTLLTRPYIYHASWAISIPTVKRCTLRYVSSKPEFTDIFIDSDEEDIQFVKSVELIANNFISSKENTNINYVKPEISEIASFISSRDYTTLGFTVSLATTVATFISSKYSNNAQFVKSDEVNAKFISSKSNEQIRYVRSI